MGRRLYVGNLQPSVTRLELRSLFHPFGVLSVEMIADREGAPHGFAYVEVPASEVEGAIRELHGKIFQGRRLEVTETRPPLKRFVAPAAVGNGATNGQQQKGLSPDVSTSFLRPPRDKE